jgi:cyanophycinase
MLPRIFSLARHALRITAAMLLATCATLAAAQGGSVLAVGSGLRDDNDVVWDRLVQLAGGRGARVAVFTAPDSEPDLAARLILARLDRRGLQGEHIRVGPNIPGQDLAAAVRDPSWVAKVDTARVVFFSGGNQALLMDTLRPGGRDSPLMTAVRGVFERGGVLAGGSAGAAVMSDVAFREPAQDVLSLMKRSLVPGRDIDQGFGFVRHDVVVDQHLLRRGRIGRLLQLMRQSGRPLGLGLEEHTAVVVRGDDVEVVGHRGVLVVDMNDAPVAPGTAAKPGGPLRVQGARLSLLDHGDRFDLATRRVTPAAAREAGALPITAGHRRTASDDDDWRVPYVNDMLAEGLFVVALGRLVDSRHRELRGLSFAARPPDDDPAPALGFEWRLALAPDTRAWRAAGSPALTLERVRLDIVPVRMAQPLYTAEPP